MKEIIKSLISEYGLTWTLNRTLYSGKLKMMSTIQSTESLFEKDVKVKRIDIFDFNIDAIKAFLNALPMDKRAEIISVADEAINGVITGFSSIKLDYGKPINWHYNPLTAKESSKEIKWYKVPDFDKEVGDIKVIWEASRLTHFFYFVRAYLLTNNKKYYDAFSSQLEDWLKNNPYSYGANFKCGQECTLRMLNALMSYTFFNKCGITTPRDAENITRLIGVCYKKVLSNFFYAHKCIKNNHTFSEICGLILGAWCCDDESGLRKAYKLLDKEIVKQFLPDGGFTQYSFNYHRFTLQIIECVYKMSEKTDIYIKETERLKNSINLLYQLQNKDGDVPNYGSNDGALIFPVTSCGYRDFRPVLNTLYALIEGKKLYVSGIYDEELLWFGNGEELPVENKERKTTFFSDSGFYSLRNKNSFLMTCLQDYKSRPAHMDQLHIDLWHKGVNIFCDAGTFSYASELGRELSSTSAHNTVKVYNTEQMNKRGAFLVTDWTNRKDIVVNDSSFKGTMVSKNKYQHTREITINEEGYLITDNVKSDKDYCEFYFHTPCSVKRNQRGFELYVDNKRICSVVTSGSIEVKKASRSLFYLKEEKINCVVFKSNIVNKSCNVEFQILLDD
ncbi:hypothetical protein ABD68_24345 [Bacillus endophyticus]|uniref:heparinase II/III domain-containing protein n=1 Tax=Priestia endophytica TaxID=135735 RepID=UPI0018CDF101|nr:heparinase II/III family protein [Priestia endophytica]MBG9814569.1 hypothetical protein [Priestia endophytica]